MSLSDKLKAAWDIRDLFLQGLGIALLIAFCALIIGFVIGVLVAIVKISPKNNIVVRILDKIAGLYITVIRGTPMLVQLLIMSNSILVYFKYVGTNLIVPILAFGINSGAYMAEIIRSGINSVDKGQMEAGRALGLSWGKTMTKIIIPQAIKVVVPTIFNEIIILVKETSVVSYINLSINYKTVYDLLNVAQKQAINTKAGCYMTFIFIAALLYLAVVLLLTFIQKFIEKKFKAGDR